MPQHQYPTTVTLAPGRRSALLDLARRAPLDEAEVVEAVRRLALAFPR